MVQPRDPKERDEGTRAHRRPNCRVGQRKPKWPEDRLPQIMVEGQLANSHHERHRPAPEQRPCPKAGPEKSKCSPSHRPINGDKKRIPERGAAEHSDPESAG